MNQNNFISRKFKNIETNEIVDFEEIINNSNTSVILGEPASGKTYQLENYEENNKNTTLLEPILVEEKEAMAEEILLFDSIDEAIIKYPAIEDKLWLYIINNKNKKFVITCRYLEWKEKFEKKLKKIDNTLKVYEIVSLSKQEINNLLKEEDREDFWKFIDNNHLESLLKNIMIIFHLVESFRDYDHNSNYIDIYKEIVKKYITQVGEDREEENKDKSLDELILIASSLATYMTLNSQKTLSKSNNLHDTANECYKINDKFIDVEDLIAIFKTALFSKEDKVDFFHKSVQEYLTAYFIDSKKLDSKTIKRIFANKLRFYKEFEEVIIYLTNIQPQLFNDFVAFDPFIFRRHPSLTKEQQEKLFLAIIDKLKNEKWMVWGKGHFFKNSSLVKFDRLDNLEKLVRKHITIDKINYTLYTYFIGLLEHNYANELEDMIFEIFQNIKDDKKFLEYFNDYFIPNLNYNKRLLKFIIGNSLITKEIGMLKNEMFFILYEAIDFKNLIPILNNLGINASIYYPSILQKLSSTDLIILFNDLKKKNTQLNDDYVVYLLLNIFNNYKKISKQINIKEIDDFIYCNLKTDFFTYSQGTLEQYKNVNIKNLLINSEEITFSSQSVQFIWSMEKLIRKDKESLTKTVNNKLKEENITVKDIELKLQQWMENRELNFSDEFYIIIRDKIKNIDLKDLSDFIKKLKIIYSEQYQILENDIKEVVLYFIARDKDNYQYLKEFWIENIEENYYYLRYMIQADTNEAINDFRKLVIKENRKILIYKEDKEDKEFDIFTIEFKDRNKIKYLLSNMGYIRIPKRQHNFIAKLDNVNEENLRFLIVSYYKCFNEYHGYSKGYRLDEYAVMSNTISKLWEYLESNVRYITLLEELSLNTIKRLSIQSRYSLEKAYNLQAKKREYPNNYYKEIFNNGLFPIMTIEDFYQDLCQKIDKLKIEIEDNRNNDKSSFYRDKILKEKRTEDECRDIIVLRLNDKYKDTIENIREKHEANNRVDINIKSKKNPNWEIQIECKRDDNSEIYTAIENQLIDKYFSSKVRYGIYLIFYFGYKKNKEKFLKKVKDSVPFEYQNNIKIICIDLTTKGNK